jgi:two-component system, OmpR family, phosphate regulon sensor histidine kinase PhoR
MKTKSIFFKIFGGYLLLTTALCGLIVVFSYYVIRSSHIETKAQELTDLATALKAEITPFLESKNTSQLEVFTKDLGKAIHARITVIDPNGVVLSDSEQNPSIMENHRTRTEIAQALDGNTGRFLRVSGTLKEEMLYIAIPVVKNNKIIYVLRVSKFLKEITTTTEQLVEKIIIIAIVICVAALIFAFLFSRSISQPVRELRGALHKVAGGNFNVKVLLKNNDELRELAESFNYMIAEMERLFGELSRQKEELDSIISSLQEGILVLDKEERVLVANKSLQTVTGKNLEKGNLYWEILREPKLNELVKRVKNTRRNATEEVELNNRTFLCSATFLRNKEEITIVFHDITEIKKLEKIKTDFVLNVSHELRTPLTSIKGFIETIETGILDDENKHYIAIIKRNTDRLINIINDLLSLSEMEEKGTKLQLEPINLKSIIEQALVIFEQQIHSKGFYIHLSVDPDLPPVQGDPYKLEQVFINLIDNAVKYMEKGGITIEMKPQDKKIVITFQDTGAGIPQEHLSRIFERFYVVDKSRSKKLGGTGLGLSIVKHIVILHNGTIHASSTPGAGTKFTITLPVDST